MSYPVFVINLDKHTDRLQFVKQQFESLGIQVTRQSACNGRDKAVRAAACDHWFAPLTPGEVGCFESHRSLWQQVSQNDAEGAFICEDDIVISSDFADIKFPTEVLEQIDIVKIDQSRPRFSLYGSKELPVSDNRSIIRMLGTEMSTGCYFVTRSGAKKLVEMSHKYILPVDVFMFDRMSPFFWNLNVWKLTGAAATQLHMVVDQSDLPAQFHDRIQGAPRPEQERSVSAFIKRAALLLYRVLSKDTRWHRNARAEIQTSLFASTERIKHDQIEYTTPSDEHYKKNVAIVAGTFG